MPKEISIQYYALLREERGLSSETCTTDATTARELYTQLQQQHQLSISSQNLQIAINDEFSNWDKQLSCGDTVVFIPPVAGG